MGRIDDLHAVLDALGVPAGAILIVHSAFRELSRQGWRAEEFIDGLIDYLGPDGTLLMPTMTWRTVTPESPVFDERCTPSHTGILSEVFRRRKATYRSLHPTHSVAGFGPLAEHLLSTHHIGNSPAAMNSPYGKMRAFASRSLILGRGLEVCTLMHHPEEIVAPEIYLQPQDKIERYTLVDRNGSRYDFGLLRHVRRHRDFPKFGSALEGQGILKRNILHGQSCLCVETSGLVEFLTSALNRDREATLAIDEREIHGRSDSGYEREVSDV